MRIEEITNLQALGFIAGIIGFAWLFFRLVPSGDYKPKKISYSRAEIGAYDHELPKYFLVAALALILGSFHAVVKNLPGFWGWLWKAGYGGHLFRDLSNSHIIIVGGGTIMLTAITWYVLPRFTNRPLFSTTLAGMSFWFTVIGVFGFYLAWLVLGLIEGNMVAHGWDYVAAKEFLGNAHKLPTAITSGIMGLGYWTYVLNVFLTGFAARNVARKFMGYLTKFALVSAGALFIGTVQGVIQVLPKNADWIHAAGKYGQYVDPISHAHINLVTGMMVSLAAFLIFFSPRMKGQAFTRKESNLLFWVLVPGSLVFYLAFLMSGLILGGAVNGYGGIQSLELVHFFGSNTRLIIAGAGTFMLAGFWVYFILLWKGLGWSGFKQEIRNATPKAFWLVSSLALVIGTFQGLLQVIPATARILTIPEEVPNIHAQLNMIGGVLLALLGLVDLLLPELVGNSIDLSSRRLNLLGVAGGIGGYYMVTLVSGLVRYGYLRQGLDNIASAEKLGWVVPALLVFTALPMFVGFLAFGNGLWLATKQYRLAWKARLVHLPERLNGKTPSWMNQIPTSFFIGAEFAGAIAGFPGIGWLMSGKGMIGVPLALVGPAVAWGVIPTLMSPYGDGPLVGMGDAPLLIYLTFSTLLSVLLLWVSVRKIKLTGEAV